jgi:hypothetical protein
MINVEVRDEDVFDSIQIWQADSQSVQHTGTNVEYERLATGLYHDACQCTVRRKYRGPAT